MKQREDIKHSISTKKAAQNGGGFFKVCKNEKMYLYF